MPISWKTAGRNDGRGPLNSVMDLVLLPSEKCLCICILVKENILFSDRGLSSPLAYNRESS